MNTNSWLENDNRLEKTFTFSNFSDAMAWMIKAAFAIEKINHHPEWTNVYNKVHVKLTTHDASNTVTLKDHELAKLLDGIH